ncbi:MAG: ABC transporter permease [Bryobacteraceae bacterium]|nr:ABC transporter permease [Bryobacteraceae bacterium]
MNLKRIYKRLRNPRRAQADLDEEVRSFYGTIEDRRVEEGVSPSEAHRVTRVEHGPPTRAIEEVRDSRFEAAIESAIHDLRYAIRQLRNNTGFAAVAVLTLALGIGANTAIYSFMESILFRSLPVADPESLVVLNWHSRPPRDGGKEWVHVMQAVSGITWKDEKGAMVSGMFPYGAFEMLSEENPVFSTLFGHFWGGNRNLSVNGQAASARARYVSGEYFRGLAVSPAAGRLIDSTDDRPGATPVAVVSFATSQSRFGSPSNAIGQPILVDNVPFTVVGVAPPQFWGVDPADVPDVYLPMRTNLLFDVAGTPRMFSDANYYWIELMGRLRPGVTIAQAQAALAPRFHRWVADTAKTDGERAKLPALMLNPGAAGLNSLRREYSQPLFVLLAMVGLLLAIACANIANLLLARATARRREMAVRLSLGAGRLRVVRQLLTESVLLSALGGALGVLFAVWGIHALTLLLSNGQANFTLHAELNWKLLGLTAALSVLCGLSFGVVPAIQATRPDVMPALKKGRMSGTGERTQKILIVAQIAISFVILVATGLFVGTLNKLHSVQLGYTRENILLFSLDAGKAGHRDAGINAFYADLRKNFESIPGVSGATFSNSSIVRAGHARGTMKVGDVEIENTRVLVAGANFLSTMQIPILIGREIDDRDQPNRTPVAVISEPLARKYFGNDNPVGRRISFVSEKRDFEIVGVSADLRYGGLKEESPMTVFLAASQVRNSDMTFALRTFGDPMRYAGTVREIVRKADSRVPVTNVVTQAGEIDRTISREVTFAALCSGFAILALIIACVGLYGTMSYSVSRQISEIGIRMALGAQRRTVVWMILRRVLLLATVGLAVSVPIALSASQLLKSFLFEIQPNDPATLALAAMILMSAAILAGYLPARRASRIDPLAALRHE